MVKGGGLWVEVSLTAEPVSRIERARSLRKRMPPAEAAMWNALRTLKPLGWHFRRQVPLGRYFADFACHGARLVIEIDGHTHSTDAEIAYDARRDAFIRGEGYRILRFGNPDVLHNIDGVMTVVMVELEGRSGAGASGDPHP